MLIAHTVLSLQCNDGNVAQSVFSLFKQQERMSLK